MARSKFPGKPSKPVNRTRINVLPSSTSEGETNTILTSCELKQDDCDSGIDTVQTTNGSVRNTVRHCQSTRRTARRKRVCKNLMARKSLSKRRHLVAASTGTSSQKLKSVVSEASQSTRKKTDKRSEKEVSNSKKLTKAKQSHIESSNLVGKFVLPSRSVHSSRVIKPNKRFINVEAVNSVQLRTFKKRVVKKNSSIKSDTDSSSCKSKYVSQLDNRECKRDHNKTFTQKNVDTSISRTPCSNRRVILRQARLQLHTQTPTGPEGPFSSSISSSSVSPPGTVTCGVCGAVRFYRFVKQARKFNIYSCESCRKFISKMIKRQVCNKKLPEIQCLKGQGMCHVPPIVRSQHWKFRCAYKARCNACWLKMCLRSFQMPASLKNSLINLLPDFMRETDTLFNNSLSLFSFHTNPNIDNRSSSIKSPSLTSITLNNKVEDFPINRRPVRKKVIKSVEKSSTTHPISDIKRQKIDLKGPRVKHVCRSASIVLGQPLAIFPDESDKKQLETVDNQSKPVSFKSESFTFENDTSENKENNSAIDNKSSNSKLENVENSRESEQVHLKNVSSKIDFPLSTTAVKRERDKNNKQALPLACMVEAKSRKRQIEIENSICIDFWENYDPEEVCRSGFGLIASVSFPMPAICFLCGSAGREPLLFCCLCCEPYHPFCLEPVPKHLNANDQCYDWLCPRCTTCNACGEADKQKFNCQKCHKAYHPECFNTKWQTDDRPTVCSSCLRCKSCGTNNITKFIGNTPLCLMCFRLRKKGNFCPLCQRCYDDNDYDTKMMECGKCKMWIHAKCEGLSEEQYQILSLLPESIEFLCCICESLPYWRKAVDSELRASFSNVLRLLSKNRVARNILKWSPMCFSPPNNKTASAVKKLQFSDDSDLSDISGNENNVEAIQEVANLRKMQKKYKLKELRVTIKPCTVGTDEVYLIPEDKTAIKTPITPSLTDIKNKLHSNEYLSLREFNESMEEILETAKSVELLQIYHSILKQVFPWYNSTQTEADCSNTSFCDTSRADLATSEDTLQNVLDNYKHKMIHNIENDNRMCAFCKGIGDGLCFREARLLYCGNNEWVHANCALWSSEVYEEIDGSLQNVHSAMTRGRLMRCSYCKQKGASIGCCAKNCHETYHFCCAHTVKCYFMHDKSIYCPSHGMIYNVAVISSSADFAIRRSVYVELDKKKKRYIEPKKVQFMVGSLCITNLGIIIPVVSDNSEAIVPSNLSCRRLFWSTVEPWKLVPYIITTRVLSSQTSNAVTDRNFTVDHTLSKLLVDKKLKEIFIWQKDSEKAVLGATEFEDDEEPQNENAADILSPELTDAILEELPHEFLDGISMQDIFPKLMSNEELLGIDFKVADVANSDLCKNDTIVPLNVEQNKKVAFLEEGKDICDSISDIKNVRELKDNKSEAFQQVYNVNKMSKVRNHQRSCNVMLSCKVDNSLSNSTKQLKAVSQEKSVYLQLLQVDGAYDNSSSSDCESTTQEVEDLWTPDILDQPVKCERCQCTYRTQASYKRHLESCEVISTSESDSEMSQEHEQLELSNSGAVVTSSCETNNTESMSVAQNKSDAAEPYVVASYESYSTYQTTQNEVHSSTLNTQTFVSTESTAEMVSVPQNSDIFFSNFQPVVEQKTVPAIFTSQSLNPGASISINQSPTITISQPSNTSVCEPTHVAIGGTQALSINQQHSSLPINHQISTNQSNELCVSQPPPLYISSQPNCSSMVNQPGTISILQSSPLPVNHAPISINQAGTISLNTSSTPLHMNQPLEMQSQQLTIQSVPITQEVSPILNISPPNQITINAKMLAAPNVVNSMVTQAVTVPQNQFVKPVLKAAVATQKSVRPRGRPRSLAAKRTRPLESRTIFVPQGTPGGPSVVVQQLPSTNMIPTFIEAFQQQTGQNLQYITTITPQITSTLTNQPQIVQLQPEGTLVNLVSGVQPTVILPQPRVLSDQILVDNNGSLMWASQPVQPIFYGFETIVQNTVLQSQQFLPSAVPGVLTANSSYSSTTQVFQTSKLEPMLDVASGNIVLLNSSPVVNSQPLQVSQNVSNHLPPAPLVISENKPAVVPWSYLEANTDSSSVEPQPKALASTPSATNATINSSCNNNSINNSSSSINLPVAPFFPEPGIPTNIVTPTPKPISSAAQSRPMNRVLPMPTNNAKQTSKTAIKSVVEKPAAVQTCEKSENQTENLTIKPQKINILDEVIFKPVLEPVSTEKSKSSETCSKEETTSLKLVFQKQREGGVYKISNSFNLKNTSSIQIAPLKPIKAKSSVAQNRFPLLEQSTSEKNTSTTTNTSKHSTKSEPKPLNEKQESAMMYTVDTQDGFHYSSTSISDLWSKVFEAVQAARIAHNMPPLPSGSLSMMSNLQILGLKTNGLKYLLEQLPGAGKCTKYKPSFHSRTPETDLEDDLDIEHPHGAARFLPYVGSHEHSDMFGWLASKHRKPRTSNPTDFEQNIRRGSITNLPMAMRFRHLKLTSKQSVGVYRSKIHKRGLFCHRDIESGEMVIEYAGEVIRSVLADKREKQYTAKGMGCYMFRIDENFVVDATMKGNAARFINHSCEPNCYSKVVEILGHKHIIIFALRKILCGEELTYDYKFPFEEDKIPCTCGSRRCRKFLN